MKLWQILTIWLSIIILNIAFFVGLIYCAIHFIHKFW